MTLTCAASCYWWDCDYRSRCILPAGHITGLHCDGLRWFDDDELWIVPGDVTTVTMLRRTA